MLTRVSLLCRIDFKVEQILPTLASKDELKTLSTKVELSAAVARLATKEELSAAVAPLATKDDIHELRRHMEVLVEDQRSDTRLLAEHLAVVMSRLPDR
jgi:hypothetical protein